MPDFTEMYDWLANEMLVRTYTPPENVVYPVWAWYKQNGKNSKPDLRRERWTNGIGGEKLVCMEIEVPDEKVLLSDFDSWSIVLCNRLLSDTSEEDALLYAVFDSLSSEDQRYMKYENWKRVFDITPFENDWCRRGLWIQATFWELTTDMIRKVQHFTAAKRKHSTSLQ